MNGARIEAGAYLWARIRHQCPTAPVAPMAAISAQAPAEAGHTQTRGIKGVITTRPDGADVEKGDGRAVVAHEDARQDVAGGIEHRADDAEQHGPMKARRAGLRHHDHTEEADGDGDGSPPAHPFAEDRAGEDATISGVENMIDTVCASWR